MTEALKRVTLASNTDKFILQQEVMHASIAIAETERPEGEPAASQAFSKSAASSSGA